MKTQPESFDEEDSERTSLAEFLIMGVVFAAVFAVTFFKKKLTRRKS